MKRGYLGVMVEPIELPQELSGSVEVGQGSGLLVRLVDYESPARAAGVALGDVILSLGETKPTDKYSLHWALEGDVIGERTSTQSIGNREGHRTSGDTEGV